MVHEQYWTDNPYRLVGEGGSLDGKELSRRAIGVAHSAQVGLADLRQDADKALRLEQPKAFEAVRASVRSIFWEHYEKTRDCWETQVQILHERARDASDPLAYHELVRKAEAALKTDDYEGGLLNYLQARRLLPPAEKARDRFFDAAIR